MAPSEQPALQAQLRDGSLAGSWTVDPARSEVVLHTRHTWGLRPLRGVFGQVSGHGTVAEDGAASGVITVTAASVDTKTPRRDKHLRSADFFDIEKHPDFTFAADSVTPTDGGVRVWLAGFGNQPFDYEIADLAVAVGGDVAFAHALGRMGSPGAFSLWFRFTVGLRKNEGTWQIAHLHASVPFYMDETRRAALDLTP